MAYTIPCTVIGFYIPAMLITAIYIRLFLISRRRLRIRIDRTVNVIESSRSNGSVVVGKHCNGNNSCSDAVKSDTTEETEERSELLQTDITNERTGVQGRDNEAADLDSGCGSRRR